MNIESEKEQFLKEFGSYYGYANSPKNIDEIRATEFKRLNGKIFHLPISEFCWKIVPLTSLFIYL